MAVSDQLVATTGTQLDQLCINTIRTLSMDAVQKANSGHPGPAGGGLPGSRLTNPGRRFAASPSSDQVVWTMNTADGALCAIELGTLPSARRTPAMPLLPTTITSAFSCSATRTHGVGRIAGPGVAFHRHPRRPGPGTLVLEHHVGFPPGPEALAVFLRLPPPGRAWACRR